VASDDVKLIDSPKEEGGRNDNFWRKEAKKKAQRPRGKEESTRLHAFGQLLGKHHFAGAVRDGRGGEL